MKKIILIITSILVAGLAFQSCTSNDQKINKEVEKVLSDSYSTVSSSTKDAVVTLTGTVTLAQEKNAAGEAVRSIKNVKEVVNNIQVLENEPTATPAINQDETIKTDIISKLEAGGYNDVTVEVSNGEVVLSGALKRSDLTKVMQIANESNPKKVINNLNLK